MAQSSTSSQSRNHVPCKVIVLGDGGIGKTCMLHSYTHQYQFLADSQQYIRTVFETYHALVDVDLSTDTDASKLQHRPTFMQLALWDTAGQENYDQLRSMAYKKTALRNGAAAAGNDSNPPTNPSGGVTSESTVEVTTLIPTFVGTSVDVSVFILCFAWNDPASLTNVQAKWNREVLRVMADVKAERAASDASSSDGRGRDPKTKKHQPMLPLHAAAHGAGGSSSSTARPFVVILCGTKCDIKAAAAPNAPGIVTYEQVDQVMTHIGADAFVSCSAKTGEGVKDVLDTAMKRWFQRVMDDLPDHSPSQGFLASICSMM